MKSTKPVICLDLDGTLKTSQHYKPDPSHNILKVQTASKRIWEIVKRPYSEELCNFIKQNGFQLKLSTASRKDYAVQMLKAMNLFIFFDEIISAEDFSRGIKFMPNCIFIDDDAEMVRLKIDKMQKSISPIVRHDAWVINSFYGNDDDTDLLEVMEELGEI